MSKTLVLARACEPIAESLTIISAKLGYQIAHSFDLQSARALTASSCPCPHHHTAQCTCQYVVLMIYPTQGSPPRTVILHEFENATRITFDDLEGTLAELLQMCLSPHASPDIDENAQPYSTSILSNKHSNPPANS